VAFYIDIDTTKMGVPPGPASQPANTFRSSRLSDHVYTRAINATVPLIPPVTRYMHEHAKKINIVPTKT
jgi:hypothetical protein